MGRLYLVQDKEEVDRRKKLLDPSLVIEVWQDLYAGEVAWLGDDASRRVAYSQKRERPPAGLFWLGESSKLALDGVGEPLPFLLAVDENSIPVYYGPRLTDIESLPGEESLRARVLSAHGIAVQWVTYNQFGERSNYQPGSPIDPTFYLRRPRGHAAHLFRLFRTKREAIAFITEYYSTDPEALEWAHRLPGESFEQVVRQFGSKG